MKVIISIILILAMFLTLNSCGGGDDYHSSTPSDIPSDIPSDTQEESISKFTYDLMTSEYFWSDYVTRDNDYTLLNSAQEVVDHYKYILFDKVQTLNIGLGKIVSIKQKGRE